MTVSLATTNFEIMECFAAMFELRPHLKEAEFLPLVRELQQQGYQIAFIKESGKVVAVAGFHFGRNLAWHRFLYVDDLVTRASERSKGYGVELLNWLIALARESGCSQFHLDSGVQREESHRFYKREGMQITSYHFAKRV